MPAQSLFPVCRRICFTLQASPVERDLIREGLATPLRRLARNADLAADAIEEGTDQESGLLFGLDEIDTVLRAIRRLDERLSGLKKAALTATSEPPTPESTALQIVR